MPCTTSRELARKLLSFGIYLQQHVVCLNHQPFCIVGIIALLNQSVFISNKLRILSRLKYSASIPQPPPCAQSILSKNSFADKYPYSLLILAKTGNLLLQRINKVLNLFRRPAVRELIYTFIFIECVIISFLYIMPQP